MQENPLMFNKIFSVIKENENFFVSEIDDKKKQNEKEKVLKFNLLKDDWCLIKKSADKKWILLFYSREKNNKSDFYISFSKNIDSSEEVWFTKYKKIENGSYTEKWMKNFQTKK